MSKNFEETSMYPLKKKEQPKEEKGESVGIKVEELTDDEIKYFRLYSRYFKIRGTLNSLLYQKKIDNETYIETSSNIFDLYDRTVEDLKEKIDPARIREIEILGADRLRKKR